MNSVSRPFVRDMVPNRNVGRQQRHAKIMDPQIVLEGELHRGNRSDYITFRFNLLLFTLTFIVVIPPEGETKAPVYIKHRIDRTREDKPGSVKIGGGGVQVDEQQQPGDEDEPE